MDEQALRKVLKAADTLEEIAENLGRMADGDEFGQKLRAGWKSENADLFMNKHERLKEEIGKTAKEMHIAAETIREKSHRDGH